MKEIWKKNYKTSNQYKYLLNLSANKKWKKKKIKESINNIKQKQKLQ